MEEIWLPITGYEDRYLVSNLSRIKSVPDIVTMKDGKVRKRKSMVLKTHKRGRYISKSLFKEGVSKSHTIHRLVALAFIPNPENKPHINHIDNNTYNNHVSNLEWVTQKENLKHAYDQGRMSKPPVKYISSEKLEKARELLDKGVTRRDVECQLGMASQTIISYFGRVNKNKKKQ